MPLTFGIFDSVHGSLDEEELSASQQRQIALMRKRREDRLIIPTMQIHRSDSSISVSSTTTKKVQENFHHDEEEEDDEEDDDEHVSMTWNHDHHHHHEEEEPFDPRKNVYDNHPQRARHKMDTKWPSPQIRKKALARRLSNELMKHFVPSTQQQHQQQEASSSQHDLWMDKAAVELLKQMDPEIVEKCILPFLSVRDLLALGLTSKNQLTISWTCLRIINEIHLKRFPHLLSNAMIEDQMDRVMAILMMKFSSSSSSFHQQQQQERSSFSSIHTTNCSENNSSESGTIHGERRSTMTSNASSSSLRLSIATTLSSSETRGSLSSNSIPWERRSWRLNDSAPLTSATLARRSIVEVYPNVVTASSQHVHSSHVSCQATSSESVQPQQQPQHQQNHHSSTNATIESSNTSNVNHSSLSNITTLSPACNSHSRSSCMMDTTPPPHRMSVMDASTSQSSPISARHSISEFSAHTFLSHIHQQQHNNGLSSMVIQPLPSEHDPNVGSFTKLVTSVKRKTRRKIFRIAVVGEKGVGKSTFIDSIFGHTVPVQHTEYSPTEKVSTYCHPYYLLTGERIELIIHDTPQIIPTQFKIPQKSQSINEKCTDNAKILKQAKKKVDLFLYCFDMSNPNTLHSENNDYFKEFFKVRDTYFPKSTLALIGLKRDIAERNIKYLASLSKKKKKKTAPSPPNPVTYIQATEAAQKLQCFKAFLGCCDMKNMFNTLHLFDIGVSLMYGQIMMKRFAGIEEQMTSPKRRSVSFIVNSHRIHHQDPHDHFSASPQAASVSTPFISRHAATISTSSPSRTRARLSVIGKKVGEGFQVLFDKFSPSHASRESNSHSINANASSFDSSKMDHSSGKIPTTITSETTTMNIHMDDSAAATQKQEQENCHAPSPIQPHTSETNSQSTRANHSHEEQFNQDLNSHFINSQQRTMILTEPVTIHEASCIILDDVSSTHSGLNNSSDGDGDRNVEKTNLHDNTKVSLHSTNDLIDIR